MYRNVLELLEKQAEERPNKIAFGDESKDISFSQLLYCAKRIGVYLKRVIPNESPVAFYMEKSVDAVCGMMGVLYAGGFYSFLDIKQPIARSQSVLDILQPAAIITLEEYVGQVKMLAGEQTRVLRLSELICSCEVNSDEDGENSLEEVRKEFCDTNPLYVNFTSGSTGVPKGVVVSHGSVLEFIENFVDISGICKDDIIANQAPFDFDVSVKDIYSGLMTGAKVQLIPRSYFSNPTELMDYLYDKRATVLIWAVSAMCFVSIMKGFEYRKLFDVRLVMFSGEILPIKHYRIWKQNLPDAVFVNLYGPTEITCNCTYYVLDREFGDTDTIPIGKAFPNEKVFLLDEKDNVVNSPMELGEICVTGTSVALGYYNDEKRTEKAFVQNPLNTRYREIMYRTGDLGRYDENGDLVYVSRKDFQIKHMGHRIELGDIEVHANACEGVTRSCCQYDDKRQRLVLFYTGEGDSQFLLKTLRESLPSFMIPNAVIPLDEMPINKNGKIDRKQLMELYWSR